MNKEGASATDRILSEAHQRQLEIMMLAEQEATILRRKIGDMGRQKLDEEVDNFLVRKRILMQARIARSEAINHYRMLKIHKKHEFCEKIFEQVELKLHKITKDPQSADQYKLFLIQSIVEGLVRMFQERIDLRCLLKDQDMLQQLIPLCIRAYKEYMQEQVGIQYQISLKIANNLTLKDRKMVPYNKLGKAEEDIQALGGVILADQTGNITFKATFDSRLNILRDICLPLIRMEIWGNVDKQSK